jgi:hypothetical protein
MRKDFAVSVDEKTGQVCSVKLYGVELLDSKRPSNAELYVNGVPLKTRLDKGQSLGNSSALVRMKGERFVNHFSGWGLVVNRDMGPRDNAKFPSFGVHYLIRRELADMDDLPCPGPGGPVVEAPLYVDTFSLLNWNWSFWGDDTRMIFPSLHSSGPTDEFGHVGYENDTPEQCKKFMRNVWRRIYPGVMGIHGGVFYNAKTGHWLAITCRRPHVGYILNIRDAGRGVGYDFTLHAPFGIGEALQLPEVKLYYGKDHDSMMRFMADYITFYYEKTPEWVYKTLWAHGLAWTNKPSWTEQADEWERVLARKGCNGISYCLVTNRPLHSGTTPMGYEPDPNHGSIGEFRSMCRRITDKGVPLLIWMSYSGLLPQGGIDIDDDWFIRGIDGRVCASWGSVDGGMAHCNPGHPGYIEYTKKWIRFYMKECGAKGFFLDCLGWAFPPDFRKRDFMRFPGDTNRMAVKFITEVYNCVKECDPEGLLFGEGTTLEAPVNLITMGFNPVRAIDGLGPRDFMLSLNRWTDKRIVLDQGACYSAACGYVTCLDEKEAPGHAAKNRAMLELLEEFGGERAFTPLPGDLGILESQNLLVVPRLQGCNDSKLYPKFTLPAPWDKVSTLTETTDGSIVKRAKDKAFHDVPPGIYRMK